MSQNKRDFYKYKLKKMSSNKRDKDDKYSEILWSLLCNCRKMMKRLIAFLALREMNALYFKLLVLDFKAFLYL